MSLQDIPPRLLMGILLWMAAPSYAQWCAPSCDGVESGTEIPDPSNCLRYYVCSETGTGTLQLSNPIDCPSGEVFDRFLTTPQCVPEASIHLDIGEYCSEYCNPCLPYCTVGGQLAPDPENVMQYYVCLGEGTFLPTPEVCTASQYFEYEAQECGSDINKTFGFCDECEPYCVEAGNIPDPYDRCSYYVCDPPEKVPFPCPSGEYFNSNTLVCEPSPLPGVCLKQCP